MLGSNYQSDAPSFKKYDSPNKMYKKMQRPGSSFGLVKKLTKDD